MEKRVEALEILQKVALKQPGHAKYYLQYEEKIMHAAKKNRIEYLPYRRKALSVKAATNIDKTENLAIEQELIESNEVTFSGTVSSLCAMTETTTFSSKIFEFTLDLYNRYSILDWEETGPSNIEDPSYLKYVLLLRYTQKILIMVANRKK
ncbi:hypothetical protein BDF21DRAFT_471747 [Thamnidium elegans]|nr:hypothetical protein BDF21DRAFT_471747 [Thamnidium elegans]